MVGLIRYDSSMERLVDMENAPLLVKKRRQKFGTGQGIKVKSLEIKMTSGFVSLFQ